MRLRLTHILLKFFTAAMLMAWRPLCVPAQQNRWSDCIDFTNIADPSVCTCYYGDVANPLKNRGIVNNGPLEPDSRHTIHTDPTETDGRTGGNVLTVPPGEQWSVRLGGWSRGDIAQAIDYFYTPTLEDGDMLILRYAVVFATPLSGHELEELPHFVLQILDENGNPLGDTPCFFADFRSGVGTYYGDGWRKSRYTYPDNNTTTDIIYKDWTTVFFSLRDHLNERLRIRIITKNCTLKEHFAYAYFTIHCERAAFYDLECGEPSTHFDAPEGFAYRWYKKSAPTATVGTDHIFDLNAGDTAVYCVDITSPTGCAITLEADPQPDLTPRLKIGTDSVVMACADGQWTLPITIEQGECDSVVLIPQPNAQAAGFPQRLRWTPADPSQWVIALPHQPDGSLLQPGSYDFLLRPYSSRVECGEPLTMPISLQIHLPSISAVQRGSYIFLLNQAHNGGYDFSGCTFQWYADGLMMSGCTSPQLCVGEALVGTLFYCVITDPSGHQYQTCPIAWKTPVFTGLTDAQANDRYGYLLLSGQTLLLENVSTALLYDAAGRLLHTYAGNPSITLVAPQSGAYILKADAAVIRLFVQ